MEEMMVSNWPLSFKVFLYVILLRLGQAEPPAGCKSNSDKPVDWFIVYKLPNSAKFYYMDANDADWKEPSTSLEDHGQAVYYTLQQIYGSDVNKSNFAYAMYNDQPPPEGLAPSKHGHSKGVIAWAKTGFWLIHSTPRFPLARQENYKWPSSAKRNGQTFLCISLQKDAYNTKVGRLLQKSNPFIYDSFGVSPIRPAGGKTIVEVLASRSGTKFTIYAKPDTDNIDIYESIAEKEGGELHAQTWRRERKRHRPEKVSKVKNIEKIGFPDKSSFKYTKDHSKWAVSDNMICIGDLNREESQKTRGGIMACLNNGNVAGNFKRLHLE